MEDQRQKVIIIISDVAILFFIVVFLALFMSDWSPCHPCSKVKLVLVAEALVTFVENRALKS